MIAKKIQKNENFTIVDNDYLRDEKLSFKAKGILTYFLSLPGDWVIYFDEIITHSKDGIRSFRSGIDELIKEGYIRRYPIRENGVIVRWETEVYEKKYGLDDQNVKVDKENQGSVNVDKDRLISTNRQMTYGTKYLENLKYLYLFQDAWNDLGPMVVKIDDILKDFKLTYDLRMLILDYSEKEVVETIKSMKTSPYARRFQVDFAWFLRRENFEKLYKAKINTNNRYNYHNK